MGLSPLRGLQEGRAERQDRNVETFVGEMEKVSVIHPFVEVGVMK